MMNRKWKRMIVSLFTAVLVIGMGTTAVKAEEGTLKTETSINVKVKEGSIVKPPTDGGGGGEGVDPEQPKGQLSIWVNPLKMDFMGDYSEVDNYDLDLVEEESLNYRRIGIADIRANETGWKLTANLTNLQSKIEGHEDIDTENYRMKMNLSVGTYLIEDGVATGAVNEDEDNGVQAPESVTIDGNATNIALAPKDTGEREGKGYTSIKMDDIQLNFDANTGNSGDYEGKIIWNLSTTAE